MGQDFSCTWKIEAGLWPRWKNCTVYNLEEIEKEIDEARTLKMQVMDAIANISLRKTPSNANTTYTTPGGSVAQTSNDNSSTPTGSLATPPLNQTIQTTGSSTPTISLATPPSNQTLQTMGSPPLNQNFQMMGPLLQPLNYQSSPYQNLEVKRNHSGIPSKCCPFEPDFNENHNKWWNGPSFLCQPENEWLKTSQFYGICVVQLGLFLHNDGLIRCKGQITNATLLASTRTPILLPAKHAFTNVTLKYVNDLIKHSGGPGG